MRTIPLALVSSVIFLASAVAQQEAQSASFDRFFNAFKHYVTINSMSTSQPEKVPLLQAAANDRDLARTPGIRAAVIGVVQDLNAVAAIDQQSYEIMQERQAKMSQPMQTSGTMDRPAKPPKFPDFAAENKKQAELQGRKDRLQKGIQTKMETLRQFADTPEGRAFSLPSTSPLYAGLSRFIPKPPGQDAPKPMRFEVVSVEEGGIVAYRQFTESKYQKGKPFFIDNNGPEQVFETDRSKSVYLTGYTGVAAMGDVLRVKARPGQGKQVGAMMLEEFVVETEPAAGQLR